MKKLVLLAILLLGGCHPERTEWTTQFTSEGDLNPAAFD